METYKYSFKINGYDIFWNSFFQYYELWHDEIGMVGYYYKFDDAVEDALWG